MRNVLTQFTLIFYLDTIHVHVKFYLSKLKMRDPFNELFMCLLRYKIHILIFISKSLFYLSSFSERNGAKYDI